MFKTNKKMAKVVAEFVFYPHGGEVEKERIQKLNDIGNKKKIDDLTKLGIWCRFVNMGQSIVSIADICRLDEKIIRNILWKVTLQIANVQEKLTYAKNEVVDDCGDKKEGEEDIKEEENIGDENELLGFLERNKLEEVLFDRGIQGKVKYIPSRPTPVFTQIHNDIEMKMSEIRRNGILSSEQKDAMIKIWEKMWVAIQLYENFRDPANASPSILDAKRTELKSFLEKLKNKK